MEIVHISESFYIAVITTIIFVISVSLSVFSLSPRGTRVPSRSPPRAFGSTSVPTRCFALAVPGRQAGPVRPSAPGCCGRQCRGAALAALPHPALATTAAGAAAIRAVLQAAGGD